MSRRFGKRVNNKDHLAALVKRMEAAVAELEACRVELQACRAELQASKARIAELEAELAARPEAAPDKKQLPPAGLIRKLAYELFEIHGGRPIDRAIHTCDLKLKLFAKKFTGLASDLTEAVITPRESRMIESTQARLTRQRDALYRRCEKEAIAELRDMEAGRHFGQDDEAPYTLNEHRRTEPEMPLFKKEEIESYLDWQVNPLTYQPTEMDFKVANTFEMIAREGLNSTQAVELSHELKRRLMAKYPQAKTFAEAVMMADKEVVPRCFMWIWLGRVVG